MKSFLLYFVIGFLEIGGCFAFWAHLRLHRSAAWILPGVLSLMAFAFLLTKIEAPCAGRAYAAYGGMYIVSSLIWMALIERTRPDGWDLLGGAICLIGSLVILLPQRPI